MKAARNGKARRLRLAGICGALAGWAALATLLAARLLLGAPRDEGVLLAGLAAGCALLMTGLAAILVDALHAGFGALDAFFAAALARATQRRDEPAAPRQPVRRGAIGDRPYVANPDGTVTVETLFGPRLFPSLADAEEFVGP